MDSLNIDYVIDKAAGVPPLPPQLFEAAEIQNSEDCGRQMDALAAAFPKTRERMLEIVNTLYYSYPDPLASLEEAVPVLGFARVRNYLLPLMYMESFSTDSPIRFNRRRFWIFSVSNGESGFNLARREENISEADYGKVYLASLCSEVGLLLLDIHFPERFRSVLETVKNEKVTYQEAEERILNGFTTSRVAKIFMENWGAPAYLTESVANANNPALTAQETWKSLVSIVHLARYVSTLAGKANYAGPTKKVFHQEILAELSLDKKDIKEEAHAIIDDRDNLKQQLELLLPPEQKKGKKQKK